MNTRADGTPALVAPARLASGGWMPFNFQREVWAATADAAAAAGQLETAA